MNMMVSGVGLTDTPIPYLLFTHVGVGFVLRGLYLAAPGTPWYGLYLLALQFLAFALSGVALLRLGASLAATLVWLAWLAIFGAVTLVSPQFTQVAALLAGAGILACLSLVQAPPRTGAGRMVLGGASLLALLLGSLVRFHAFLLALMVLLPLVLTRLAGGARRGARSAGVALLAGAVTAASLLVWAERRYYAASPGWERFFEYGALRAEFTDRQRVSYSPDRLADLRAVGWTEVDLEMLRNWFYMDPEVYSLDRLRFLASRSPEIESVLRRARHLDLGAILRGVLFTSYGAALALFLAVSQRRARSRQTAWRPLVHALWAVLLLLAFTIVERAPPQRVWLPVLALAALAVLGEAVDRPGAGEPSLQRGAIPVLASALALFVGGSLVAHHGRSLLAMSRRHQHQHAVAMDDLRRLAPRPDQLYVVWGSAFPLEAVLPVLATPSEELRRFKILGLGVGSHEPMVQGRLRQYGIEDLYQDFYRRDDVFLVAPRTPYYLDLLGRYVRQHYGVAVATTLVFDGQSFAVFRLKRG
jgi:hypothetical protein